MNTKHKLPIPVVNRKELDSIDTLTAKYNKMIEPGKIALLGQKAGDLVPEGVKDFSKDLGLTISEQELYAQTMDILGKGFKALEEQAAKFSINEKQVINKINKKVKYNIVSLEEVCLIRSYDLDKVVSSYKGQDIFVAAIEGAGTGYMGFFGVPFNIVLSTFLYFRAVQSIAMFYGYDVKNDSSEMVIASEVFSNALSPVYNDAVNEVSNIIGKIMIMSKLETVKQVSKKTWTEMALQGGIPLLLTQMRALAHKSAKKALEKAGKTGLENTLFKETFEQIGKKLTKKTIGRSIPYFSAFYSALSDTTQMKQVLDFANIFYQKRFIMEKEKRIAILTGEFDDINILDRD